MRRTLIVTHQRKRGTTQKRIYQTAHRSGRVGWGRCCLAAPEGSDARHRSRRRERRARRRRRRRGGAVTLAVQLPILRVLRGLSGGESRARPSARVEKGTPRGFSGLGRRTGDLSRTRGSVPLPPRPAEAHRPRPSSSPLRHQSRARSAARPAWHRLAWPACLIFCQNCFGMMSIIS